MSPGNALSDQEYAEFKGLIQRIAGIQLSDSKRMLVAGQLQRRLRQTGSNNFQDYHRKLASSSEELQFVIDLLTTNETYFFREPAHFDFLQRELLPAHGHAAFRAWSAASSSGEEAYSLAMTCAEHLRGSDWEILGSDISARMLAQASSGRYGPDRASGIPATLMKKYCRSETTGDFVIVPELQRHLRFRQINLTAPIPPGSGSFDLIFLRNVLFYFDSDTKRRVIGHLLPRLKSGGHLIVSHTESLHGLGPGLELVRPSIYRKSA